MCTRRRTELSVHCISIYKQETWHVQHSYCKELFFITNFVSMTKMELPKRVVLASDHAGYSLKEHVKKYFVEKGVDIVDVGTFSDESVNCPDIIRKGCGAVIEHGCFGFIFGGSGNGEAMVANKVPGIRAALVYSEETANLARAHNDANVMSLGGRLTAPEEAEKFIDIFLSTQFDSGRHKQRVDSIENS